MRRGAAQTILNSDRSCYWYWSARARLGAQGLRAACGLGPRWGSAGGVRSALGRGEVGRSGMGSWEPSAGQPPAMGKKAREGPGKLGQGAALDQGRSRAEGTSQRGGTDRQTTSTAGSKTSMHLELNSSVQSGAAEARPRAHCVVPRRAPRVERREDLAAARAAEPATERRPRPRWRFRRVAQRVSAGRRAARRPPDKPLALTDVLPAGSRFVDSAWRFMPEVQRKIQTARLPNGIFTPGCRRRPAGPFSRLAERAAGCRRARRPHGRMRGRARQRTRARGNNAAAAARSASPAPPSHGQGQGQGPPARTKHRIVSTAAAGAGGRRTGGRARPGAKLSAKPSARPGRRERAQAHRAGQRPAHGLASCNQ